MEQGGSHTSGTFSLIPSNIQETHQENVPKIPAIQQDFFDPLPPNPYLILLFSPLPLMGGERTLYRPQLPDTLLSLPITSPNYQHFTRQTFTTMWERMNQVLKMHLATKKTEDGPRKQ